MFDIKDFINRRKAAMGGDKIETTRTLKQHFVQGNPFHNTTMNRGSKMEKATLMLQWAHTRD